MAKNSANDGENLFEEAEKGGAKRGKSTELKPLPRKKVKDIEIGDASKRESFSAMHELLKEEVGDAIDPTVFDEETAPVLEEEAVSVPTTARGESLLSRDRLKTAAAKTYKTTTHASFLDMGDAERFYPSVEEGLSLEQVQGRNAHGYVNAYTTKAGKSYLRIILSNVFTFFNVVMFLVCIALIVFQAPVANFFFMGIVALNVGIGIYQEIRSKITVEKLKLVTAPTAIVIRGGVRSTIPVAEVVLDDIVYFETGKQICADAVVVKGEMETNEALLTGESEPVKKVLGAQLLSGSFVSSGSCYARVEKVGGANYVERLTSYAKRYKKPKSELNAAVTRIIKAVSIIIVPVTVLLLLSGRVTDTPNTWANWQQNVLEVAGAVIGMIPSGLFLLTSVALFTGIIRLAKRHTLVQDLYCIEMLARVNVLCLDKTGTITDGTMHVTKVSEIKGNAQFKRPLKEIVGSFLTATGDNNQTALALADHFGYSQKLSAKTVMPFSSQRKYSAVTFNGEGGTFVLGAPEFILKDPGVRLQKEIDEHAAAGLRVILLAHAPGEIKDNRLPPNLKAVAVVAIEDHIREDAVEVIKWFKENHVAVRIISGDNPLTVSEVAARVGVENASKYISLEGMSNRQVVEAAKKYTVFGRVTPEQKRVLVKAMKAAGETVAMTGDGVNDILAMREADCAIAIASGAEAARNVSHLVLLDSNFSSMPQVVLEGRRVVNNIQNSASLFVMKTIMTVVLAFISIALRFARVSDKVYFFDTANMIPLELFIIGIPSFFLAFQPNKSIIKDNFLATVLKRSLPGGLALACVVLAVYGYGRAMGGLDLKGGPTVVYDTMLVAGVVFAGYMALIKICQPYTAYKVVLLISTLAVTVLALSGILAFCAFIGMALPFGESVVNVFTIGFNNITFLLCVILLSYFLIAILTRLMMSIKLGGLLHENNRAKN
ncbi:MAG: HAD-IC family P-type ATPase [Clostridiales bacterium]|jgi:cation-transporting ATPase E|nr:HAD-IC family P-type ATPase [Clostridiales bacterium]